jgi:predicted dienelactone hydrolase
MRTFEAVLILVNLLWLILSVKNQSKTAWCGIAGVNLSAFLIHGTFEGLRYQMVFSYLFVILLAFFTLIKALRKSEVKTPKALHIIAVSLSFVLLGFTSFLAYALPVFTLPKPTGSHVVGIQYFHLIDESRTDPFLTGSIKKRELMVKVYYPAREDETKPFSRYFGNSPELIKSFAAFYNMPDFAFDHLNLVKTNSKKDLPLSDQQPAYPVVLFSHGAGTSMEVQTTQIEDLASHGYIVVAIDHTYVSAATVFPDRLVSHKEATTDFKMPEPAEIITQIMAEDASFVIDTLIEMNDGTMDSIFAGRLELENIGAIGHSVGGAVAYNLVINDPRVKAAINLDGRVYILPKDSKDIAPFLMFASDTYHFQALQEQKSLMQTLEEMADVDQNIMLSIYGSKAAYHEAYQRDTQNVIGLTEILKGSKTLFTIEGSDHMKFTDIGLFIGLPQLRELIGIRGEADPVRCLEITKAVTLAFFDQHLKGETRASPESLFQKYPELKRTDLR